MATRMPLEYLKCRTRGHAWDDFQPLGMRPPGWGVRESLRCARCATERHTIIDALGEVSTRRYEYPEGYKLAADETPTRAAMRVDLRKQLRAASRERVARQRKAG